MADTMTLLSRGIRLGLVFLGGLATLRLAGSVLADVSTADMPLLWWAARAFGFVAYAALTLSMLFGVLVPARGLDAWIARKTVLDLHQQWTLAAVIATALHVLAIVLHAESHISVVGALVPFRAERLTGAMALGSSALWGLAVLALSSWLRRRLPYAAWRAIHGIAFGTFVLAVVHGFAAGTDSAYPIVQWAYIATTAAVAGATLFRVLLALAGRVRVAPNAARRA